MSNQTEAITTLIEQRKSVSLIDLHQQTTAELWERHRQYYVQALNAGVISLLFSLVREAGQQEGAGGYWQSTFETKPLTIRINPHDHIRVTHGDRVICSNETPGKEFILPGQWMFFVRESLELVEANRIHQQQQQALRDHQEAVQIFSVLEA